MFFLSRREARRRDVARQLFVVEFVQVMSRKANASYKAADVIEAFKVSKLVCEFVLSRIAFARSLSLPNLCFPLHGWWLTTTIDDTVSHA